MKAEGIKRTEVTMEELEAIVAKAGSAPLCEKDCQTLLDALHTLGAVTATLEQKNASLKSVRYLLFGPKTEKTKDVLDSSSEADTGSATAQPADQGNAQGAKEAEGLDETPDETQAESESESGCGSGDNTSAEPKETSAEKPKRKGHGRIGHNEYANAERIEVKHESLSHGDACPQTGCEGRVYKLSEPAVMVRIVGQAPLKAKIIERERLRCNLCGETFTAQVPEGLGSEKYEPSAASMIALLRYGTGLPTYRLAGLQGSLGAPLPPATQYQVAEERSRKLEAIFSELENQAAQGEVIHNDDTVMTILARTGKRLQRKEAREGKSADRKGVFTTGIISQCGEHKIALFFTGPRHAGENLAQVLKQRSQDLTAPIQMCDGLDRNLPAGLKTIVANCIPHGRRKFVKVHESFPQECRVVLEALAEVYRVEARCKEAKLTPKERLELHQRESKPQMDRLKEWMEAQLRERKVEEHSGVGEAMGYMLRRWERMTLFLRVEKAPLDNNIVERSLKRAILHRKNSMFYLSDNGARVGDLYMSLIHTAELCGANPLDYLESLMRNAETLESSPGDWLPWTYRDTLARLSQAPLSQASN
jgi:hypothetical protein